MAAAKMGVAELGRYLRAGCPLGSGAPHARRPIESANGETRLLRQIYNGNMLRPVGTCPGRRSWRSPIARCVSCWLSAIGPVGLIVTTNLIINFLPKVRGRGTRIMRLGMRSAVGEVTLLPDPITHLTAIYSIPNE